MTPEDLAYAELSTISRLLKERAISSESLTQALLARIGRVDARLHCFSQLRPDDALTQARAADLEIAAGRWRGPLHGVPLAVKDTIDIEGMPTTAGMAVLKDEIATVDATVVARLRRAGAILLGKTQLTEGAAMDHHPHWPRPTNPWSETLWTGASSSGSAIAVSAGLCFGALATDTGGSIRSPAAACGVTGLKPSRGRVSLKGVFPFAPSLDHLGMMSRSVVDAAMILQAVGGHDPKDPHSLARPMPFLTAGPDDLNGIVIGFDTSSVDDVDPAVRRNVYEALSQFKALGARVHEIDMPSLIDVAAPLMALIAAEAAEVHQPLLERARPSYGKRLAAMLDFGALLPASVADDARRVQARFSEALYALFEGVDLILTPATPVPTPSWEQYAALSEDLDAMMRLVGRYTIAFNGSGHPTLSLPSGLCPDGRPLGVQLVGRQLGEATLCQAGRAYQAWTGNHRLRPPIV